MKSIIKRFFTLALLTISFGSYSTVSAAYSTNCDVEKVLEEKLGYILASTTKEVKEWKAWIEDIIKAIPNTAENSIIIKELEFIKRFNNTTAIGARLKKNKHLYPPRIVSLLTEQFTENQILEILARRTGKRI